MNAKLSVKGGRLYVERDGEDPVSVRLVRARPRTDPQGEIVALDQRKREVGSWVNLAAFDPESRPVAEAALLERYHEPAISRMIEVLPRFGTWQVTAETDHGVRRFAVRHPDRTVETMADGRVLIRDVLGNRYIIRNPGALDAASLHQLSRLG